jgi:hypothetical protein
VKSRFPTIAVLAAVLFAAAAGPARADDPPPAPVPTVKMPAEVKIPPGRLASIVIESNGKVTKFGCLSTEVDIFREYDPDPAKIRVRVIAYTPGKYAIFAHTALADVPSDPAVCWLTVGDPVPPTPRPPAASGEPADPLARAIRAAYAEDASDGKAKAEYLAALESVFRQADPSGFQYVGQFRDLLQRAAASKALMPQGAMPRVSAEVAKFLKDHFAGADLTAFTPASRESATANCVKLADALKSATP